MKHPTLEEMCKVLYNSMLSNLHINIATPRYNDESIYNIFKKEAIAIIELYTSLNNETSKVETNVLSDIVIAQMQFTYILANITWYINTKDIVDNHFKVKVENKEQKFILQNLLNKYEKLNSPEFYSSKFNWIPYINIEILN